jgi:hypothetical protein
VAAVDGQPGRAVRLAAAATAARGSLGNPSSPGVQAGLERWLAPTRHVLGSQAAAEWAGGLKLSPAQAIACALGDDGAARNTASDECG